jgi:hypothetical protein
MILPPKGLKQVYDTIKLESLRGGCTVLVLVAPDVDAIAACRIVTTALCADLISFNVTILLFGCEMLRKKKKKTLVCHCFVHDCCWREFLNRAVFFFFFFFFHTRRSSQSLDMKI